jgi:hypothetical protein
MHTKCSNIDCDRMATVHFTSQDSSYVYGLCQPHYAQYNMHIIIDALYTPITIITDKEDN